MSQPPLERAILFGLAAGMRTSAPVVSCARSARPWEWYALLGELVVDKLPVTPSRLMAGGWIGRIATAGYGAYRDAEYRGFGVLEHVAAATMTAFLATKLAHEVRHSLTRPGGFPDPLIALLEDALTLACVVRLRDPGGVSDAQAA